MCTFNNKELKKMRVGMDLKIDHEESKFPISNDPLFVENVELEIAEDRLLLGKIDNIIDETEEYRAENI